MDRIVDITTDKVHLSSHRGLLIVTLEKSEIGRLALDDIAALIVHAYGVTWTTNLVIKLAQRGAMMVLCAANHSPVAMMIPVEGHHAQNAKFRAQWDIKRPLMKSAWKQIVIAKVLMQASLLEAHGKVEAQALAFMADKIRSGDPDNIEAQAARRYWPALMGTDFRRDRDADGANALLNYGYTIIRSLVARSIIAAGLHPTIGLHHANRMNAFALADDLVEPFRPLVDAVVWQCIDDGMEILNPIVKQRLTGILSADLNLQGENSPVSIATTRLAQSLASSFENKKISLSIFSPPDSLTWHAIARYIPDGETR